MGLNAGTGRAERSGSDPRFRVGFLTDGPLTNKQYHDVMQWVQQQPDMEVAAILIQDRGSAPGRAQLLAGIMRRRGVGGLMAQIGLSILSKMEMIGDRRLGPLLRLQDYSDVDAPRINLSPIVSKSGLVHRYWESDLERVAELNLDVIVRCGTGILRGGILHAARHGILSLHHGDNRVNRGGPPGFWEVLRREPSSGFIVQRLSEEVDGGEVLARASIRTQMSFLKNQAALYETSTDYLTGTIRALSDGTATAEPPHIYHHPLLRQPRLAQTIAYAGARFSRLARRLFEKAMVKRPHWSVAYLKGDWRSAVLWRGKVVPELPGTFIADPFVVEREGRTVVFVEEYRYSASQATIAAYEIHDGTSERLGTALDEPFHLSYPFLFESGDELLMCPETGQARQIRLYRCVEFPLKWELDTILMDGVNAVDTDIFRHGEHWWMLTSINSGFDGCTTTLNAFYGPSPRGPWTAHSGNPLITDVEAARNGGMVTDGATVYRLAQSGNFGQYGNRLQLRRIDRLDPDHFEETIIQSIGPGFMPGACGIHHLHAAGGTVVFDFWRPRHRRLSGR